jgi:LuxR family transcriptional regulator, maltose regulon positive regulatory protein
MSEAAQETTQAPDNTINVWQGDVAQGGRLLATKLCARPARANLVARPRLIGLLDDGRSASLILVSAPAGFGKTTLLAEWLGHGRQSTCWLSLDAADNDPARFLAYVIAALQQVVPGVANDLVGPLRSSEPPPAETVLAALVNELALVAGDFILVLDDYHFITSPAVNEALTFLLENLPSNLHLVISSRADPPIPVARLRSQGQVVEVRSDELRFTVDEAAAFLRQTMGLALTPAQVAALGDRTEGWIAGLQLAALSMRGREDVDGFIQGFAGTNRFILDLLVEEVLAREPAEVQTFLLQTAILTRLCGPLCDAVTGGADGQAMLERLERRNLFVVSLDDDRRWYRYHHLFADLLQARLYQSGSAPVAALLSRAAGWCEQDGQFAEAVGYALAAGDYARAGNLVERYWGLLANDGEIETVWSWFAVLPEEVVRSSAPLSVACCWVLWLKGQIGLIEPHLADAERVLNELAGRQPRQLAEPEESTSAGGDLYVALPAQVATLRAIAARYSNDFASAYAYAAAALTRLPPDLPLQASAQLRSLIFLALATSYDGAGDLAQAVDAYAETIRWSRLGRNASGVGGITYRLSGVLRLLGRLDAAEAACREALRFFNEQGLARLPAAGILHLALAEVLLERNELANAEDHLAQATELGKHSGRLDTVRNAGPALARLLLAYGDVSAALATVAASESALGEPSSPLARAELLAIKAKILVWQGSLLAADKCVQEAVQLAGADRGLTGATVALAASRVHLAQHERNLRQHNQCQPGTAVSQLASALVVAEEAGRWGAVIELHILRSLALAWQGELRAAEAELQRALALAEPERYVRIFVDEGEPLATLLRKLATCTAPTSAGGSYSAQFLSTLIEAFDAGGDDRASTSLPQRGATTFPAGANGGRRFPTLIEPLSERELEVLRLLAEGRTNEQIARTLTIALGTAKTHVHNVTAKLGAQNRAQAVARGRELNLL